MKRHLTLLGVALFAFALGSCKPKAETLSLLVWEGYADPSFIQPF
jgi:spermidine/putrescine-binding protein